MITDRVADHVCRRAGHGEHGATKRRQLALPRVAHISFALYMASCRGVSFAEIAARLALPIEFVEERVEAARLCVMAATIMEKIGMRAS